ncbi:hypothetical protein L484_016906 [Morus notabilis]|uniref:Uncharacterized protein n=1 Tax=Morus notabilis TaxID=981085 RepID=W9RVQ8_9ROSA|nr:hypothetical protein L484_016906 [Morus notabilis]
MPARCHRPCCNTVHPRRLSFSNKNRDRPRQFAIVMPPPKLDLAILVAAPTGSRSRRRHEESVDGGGSVVDQCFDACIEPVGLVGSVLHKCSKLVSITLWTYWAFFRD